MGTIVKKRTSQGIIYLDRLAKTSDADGYCLFYAHNDGRVFRAQSYLLNGLDSSTIDYKRWIVDELAEKLSRVLFINGIFKI